MFCSYFFRFHFTLFFSIIKKYICTIIITYDAIGNMHYNVRWNGGHSMNICVHGPWVSFVHFTFTTLLTLRVHFVHQKCVRHKLRISIGCPNSNQHCIANVRFNFLFCIDSIRFEYYTNIITFRLYWENEIKWFATNENAHIAFLFWKISLRTWSLFDYFVI